MTHKKEQLGIILLSLTLVSCDSRAPKARPLPQSEECCTSYGEFSADGNCMGHGPRCCFHDSGRADLCNDGR